MREMSLHDFHRVQERLRSVADPIEFLVNLFTHAPVGFAVWDAQGYPLLTNAAFLHLFGSEPPPEYNVLKDTVLAESGMLALFERAFKGETVKVPTFWYDPRELKNVSVSEGRRVAISMTIFPLFKSTGEIEYVAATYKDETDITLANERLRMNQETNQLAQQAARVATFEWNIQTGVNRWPPELEAMYGLAPGEFGKTQQSWEQLVHPEDCAAAIKKVEQAFESFLPVEGEWRVVWPDGSVHWLVGRFQVFKDETGKPQRLLGVNLDITARKSAENEIRRLNENLEQLVLERTAQLRVANQELEAFSYSVAHDLRSPLRAINGFGSILIEDCADKVGPANQGYLKRIVAGASRMGEIIDTLLALARLTRAEPRWETVNLTALVRKIGEQLQSAEPTRHPELVVMDDLVALGDPQLLQVALENLLGNAWKFTSKRNAARIEFGCTEIDGKPTYFVRDNGSGFDMALAEKLFVPFRRLHTDEQFEGTGIGLATVQRIIHRHGGRIWAKAAEDKGAAFYFTLSGSSNLP